MKIAFVTGCLEPGHDGVGDYTRTLANECVRRGHTVRLLSLAEKGDQTRGAGAQGDAWRLTPAEWRKDGGASARQWLDRFGPDWVSLQFVPYSFDPRGFFGPSIAPLTHIAGAAPRRHVFFHEIWIGSQRGAPLKARLTGWWQRRAIVELLQRVSPESVHSSTAYYCAALASIGQRADILPMLGSVPRALGATSLSALASLPPDALVCGHFGTLHPDWQPDSFLDDFATLAAAHRRPAVLMAAGSLGYGAKLFRRLSEQWKGRVQSVTLGRLDADQLSAAFARFDFAVTSVPWNILGKSSSAAALREHGLRVVVTAGGSPPRFASPEINDAGADPGFVPYFRDHAALATALDKTSPRPGVLATAERFLADLNDAG